MSEHDKIDGLARQRSDTEPQCSAPDPLRLLEEEHALQRELCDLLEQIADGLPHAVSLTQAKVAHAILSSSFTRHTKFEEGALFPLLRKRIGKADPICAVIERLCAEHDQGDGEIVEILDVLNDIMRGSLSKDASGLGYLLRSFFESQRKHIAWEDEVLIPAARRLLNEEDLANMQSWIMSSDYPRCCKQSIISIRAARAQGTSICQTCRSAQQFH